MKRVLQWITLWLAVGAMLQTVTAAAKVSVSAKSAGKGKSTQSFVRDGACSGGSPGI